MRVTLKNINAALKAKGYKDELFKGYGYFYFMGDDAMNWNSGSVMTPHLTSMSVEEWVQEYEEMKNNHLVTKG